MVTPNIDSFANPAFRPHRPASRVLFDEIQSGYTCRDDLVPFPFQVHDLELLLDAGVYARFMNIDAAYPDMPREVPLAPDTLRRYYVAGFMAQALNAIRPDMHPMPVVGRCVHQFRSPDEHELGAEVELHEPEEGETEGVEQYTTGLVAWVETAFAFFGNHALVLDPNGPDLTENIGRDLPAIMLCGLRHTQLHRGSQYLGHSYLTAVYTQHYANHPVYRHLVARMLHDRVPIWQGWRHEYAG